MAEKVKIIVADDQELFRKALIALLKTNPELEIISEAANGRELLEQLKLRHADIVLLDTDMPVMDGKAALEIIHRRFPKVKIIILSFMVDPDRLYNYIAHGANSYLSRGCDVETLFKAISMVMSEGYFFDSNNSKALLDSLIKERQNPLQSSEISFNERETEIVKGICDGKTNKEIALELHLSPSAIDFYKTRIYNKTQCHNTTSLLKYALKNGIVALT